MVQQQHFLCCLYFHFLTPLDVSSIETTEALGAVLHAGIKPFEPSVCCLAAVSKTALGVVSLGDLICSCRFTDCLDAFNDGGQVDTLRSLRAATSWRHQSGDTSLGPQPHKTKPRPSAKLDPLACPSIHDYVFAKWTKQ
jgi:hypothetical protein